MLGCGEFRRVCTKNKLIGKVSWILTHFIKEARSHLVKLLVFKWLNIGKLLSVV